MSKRDSEQQRQPSHTRVAVDVLQRDQRAMLFDGDPDREPPLPALTDGFETRREFINWWQAAAVRTFGHLKSSFPSGQIIRDRTLHAAMLADEPTAEQAHLRQRLLERVVRSCNTAYRDLEARAEEWLADSNDTDTDWQQIDPAEQRHIAMRPAFSRLDREQARALEVLWGGFEDREAIIRWTHSLPAVADFGPVLDGDEGLTASLVRDGHALEQLQAGDGGREWRERFAATVLLPAFGTRATKLQAGERAESTQTDRHVPHG